MRAIRPTDGTGVLVLHPDEVDPSTARKVLDLAMRVAEMMLSHGASANDTTVNLLRVTKAYDLKSVHVDVTYTSIAVSYYRGHDREPLSTMRVVRARSIDYTRLQRLQALVNSIEGGLDVDEAYDLFGAIVRAPHPYRRWVVTFANAMTAAAVCLLRGASLQICVIAFVAAGLVDLLVGRLARHQLPAFFIQVAAAAVPTTAAIATTWAAASGVTWLQGLRPELIVAGGIVVMLSGLSAVGAAQDAIDGYYVTAGARTFEVLLMTLGIVVGILAALLVAQRAGLPAAISGDVSGLGSLPQQLVAAVLISVLFAIATYAGPRTVVLCGMAGLLGWCGYIVGIELGLGEISSSAFGAVLPSALAGPVARRFRVPALALVTSGLVPLMPGTMVYRGIFEMMGHSHSYVSLDTGTLTLVQAGGVGLALAAGASLGTYLSRPGKGNLRHAAPRGQGSSAEKSAELGTPEAERVEAILEEASHTGTLPVVTDHRSPGHDDHLHG